MSRTRARCIWEDYLGAGPAWGAGLETAPGDTLKPGPTSELPVCLAPKKEMPDAISARTRPPSSGFLTQLCHPLTGLS